MAERRVLLGMVAADGSVRALSIGLGRMAADRAVRELTRFYGDNPHAFADDLHTADVFEHEDLEHFAGLSGFMGAVGRDGVAGAAFVSYLEPSRWFMVRS